MLSHEKIQEKIYTNVTEGCTYFCEILQVSQPLFNTLVELLWHRLHPPIFLSMMLQGRHTYFWTVSSIDCPVLNSDINGCVLSYFEGTANLHRYTSCTLTTQHCRYKVSFLQCCHMKRYKECDWGVYLLLSHTVYSDTHGGSESSPVL